MKFNPNIAEKLYACSDFSQHLQVKNLLKLQKKKLQHQQFQSRKLKLHKTAEYFPHFIILTIKLPMTVSKEKLINMIAIMIFCVRLYGDDGFPSVDCVDVTLMSYSVTFCKFSRLQIAVVCVK